MEDLTGQTPSTSITDVEWNQFLQEFKNYLNDQFVTMAAGDPDQLSKATAMFAARVFYQVDSGAADAYVTTVQSGMRAPGSYQNGIVLAFRPTNANTGAATVNMAGKGIRDILREDGTALQANDMVTTRDAWMRFDTATNDFFLLNFSLGAPAQALPDGWIKGLTMGRNNADLTHDVITTVGGCRSADNTTNLLLASAWNKRFDASITLGTGGGGYPGTTLGVRTASTWYRFFIIGHTDGRAETGWDSVANDDAAALLTDFNTADAAPGTWTTYRQIGWSKTTTTITILHQMQNTDHDPNHWRVDDYGGTYVTRAVPPTVQTLQNAPFAPPASVAIIHVDYYASGGQEEILSGFILDADITYDPTPLITANNIELVCVSTGGSTERTEVRVNASSQFNERYLRHGSSSEVGKYSLRNPGFRWER